MTNMTFIKIRFHSCDICVK